MGCAFGCKSEFLHPPVRKGRGAGKRIPGRAVGCCSCLQKANYQKACIPEGLGFFQRKTFLITIAPAHCLGPAQARRVLRVLGSGRRAAEQHLGHLEAQGTVSLQEVPVPGGEVVWGLLNRDASPAPCPLGQSLVLQPLQGSPCPNPAQSCSALCLLLSFQQLPLV